MSNEGALAEFDPHAALEQIAAGKLMHQLATEYGVVKSAIRKKLLKSVSKEDYDAAIVSQAENLVDEATAELMSVPADAVLIARARAKVDGAHKWAAARDAKNWGSKHQIDVTGTVKVDHTLKTDASALLDSIRGVANTPSIEGVAVRLPYVALHNDSDDA